MNSEAPGEKIEALLDRLLSGGERAGEGAPSPVALPARLAGCPEDAVWQRIASRLPVRGDALALIEHASGCRRCGALLCYWTGILSGEESAEETLALAGLSSQSRPWQERIAVQLYAEKTPARADFFRGARAWLSLLAVTGAVAATGLFFLFLNNSGMQASPEKLLAEAYTGHRTMEMRIPLAGFAAVDPARHTRGGVGGAEMRDSAPLLEARAAITQALMKTPEDAHWLLLQARADLLNENYDPAIDTLRRLLASDSANVSALTDLASAYLMRARATDTATDEASALDYLEQAARVDAKNPVVLYNEAVVLQELYQYSNAIDVWRRFLAVEHDRAWAEDGRRRLAEIEAREAKVKAQQSRLDPFLAGPEGMLHLARSPAVVAEYDEELSTLRFPQILRAAFPLPPAASSAGIFKSPTLSCDRACSDARVLLQAIAASLEEHHRDRWLADFLAGAAAPDFAAGANRLADAIDTGQHSHFAQGLQNAQVARALFLKERNTAGAARAGVEEVFDLEHFLDDRRCLQLAKTLPAEFAARHSPWIEAQYWADESACHLQQDGFRESRASLERSLEISQRAKYRIVHLRSFGFLASNLGSVGNREAAWKMNVQGLRMYWRENYPIVRAYGFYFNLGNIEESSERPLCSLLLHREALAAVAGLGFPQLVNVERFLLVKAEIRAGAMDQAAHDIGIAQRELAGLPSGDKLRGALAAESIQLADAYLARGDSISAASTLHNVSSRIAELENRDLELGYAAATGHLAMLQGRSDEAETQLNHAIDLAERGYAEARGTQERIDWIAGARPVYAALTLLELHQGKRPVEALAVWERYRLLSGGISLSAWCHGNEWNCLAQPLKAARQTLGRDTVVGTLLFDRSLLLWTMDDHGVQVHETTIDPGRWNVLSHGFFETLATPVSGRVSVSSYGNRLSAALLSPLSASLDPRRTLVFDLDDSMEFLPVSALPWKGNYLGLQFAITTVHSLLSADAPAPDAKGSLRSVVVGASNPGDPDVPRLPEARSEALTVAGFLAQPRIFAGSDAVVNSIKTAAPHAALLHLAGHARFANGGMRLLLARPAADGPDWLDARDFHPHEFANCRLVVLSACSTGKREERDSGDIQDMVQTLIGDGARQVVATHWDVDSAVSESLMKEFYSALAQGRTVPQALLRAEQSISSTQAYANPYYWSPYYVAGLDRTNLKELFHHD